MKNLRLIAALAVTAMAAVAQNPPAQRGPGTPGGARAAQSFLARTAELELTDAQVVKLAAIARRAETRQRAIRASMDSAGRRFTQPGDSAARRQFAERMRTTMERERDQGRVDLRDALAVLTADQQARAWEMSAQRARAGARGARGAGRAGRMGMPGRGGAPGRHRPGMGPDRMGQGGPGGMGPGAGAPGPRRQAMPPARRPE